MKIKEQKTKPAYVENIILWIVLFISFVTLFFFIVEYSVTIKVIDKANSLSEYGARAVALGKSDSDVVDGLNQIRGNSFNTITVDNLTCIENGATENYQVIFNTYTTYENNFLSDQGENNIHAKSVVFNEVSSTEKVCDLYITIGN